MPIERRLEHAVVAVDLATGTIGLSKYVPVHDCGHMIYPAEVTGQYLGALAHGVGGAIYEEIVYDENGQPLTQNFKDYMMPTAVEIPHFALDHTISPNPRTPDGFNGAGEAGSGSAPPCLANAVADALAPAGLEIWRLPSKPEFIWQFFFDLRGDQKPGRKN